MPSKTFKQLLESKARDLGKVSGYANVQETFVKRGLDLKETIILRSSGKDSLLSPKLIEQAEQAAIERLDELVTLAFSDFDFFDQRKASKSRKVKYRVKSDSAYGLRDKRGRVYSSRSLASAINIILSSEVKKHMGAHIQFRNQTGRFAESAQVLGIQSAGTTLNEQTAKGVSFLFTYMKYPYQVFEAGRPKAIGRVRDPRRVITLAIKSSLTRVLHNESLKLIERMGGKVRYKSYGE